MPIRCITTFLLKVKRRSLNTFSNLKRESYGVKCHFQQYFRYIVAVTFIGGGNRCTRRKPLQILSDKILFVMKKFLWQVLFWHLICTHTLFYKIIYQGKNKCSLYTPFMNEFLVNENSAVYSLILLKKGFSIEINLKTYRKK